MKNFTNVLNNVSTGHNGYMPVTKQEKNEKNNKSANITNNENISNIYPFQKNKKTEESNYEKNTEISSTGLIFFNLKIFYFINSSAK